MASPLGKADGAVGTERAAAMQVDMAVVGAGPAGLCAALEAASAGARVALIDENHQAGGQLPKQIHPFFGSRAHHAGERGFHIGQRLAAEASRFPNLVWMPDTVVYGLFSRIWPEANQEFPGWSVGLASGGRARELRARAVVLATGASEKSAAFPGWTLPGVMGAGALQTLVNQHRVLPGRRILMLGAGNVGLIVSYQMLQAGARVLAVVEPAAAVGGYAVHAAKLRRAGVPILLRSEVAEVRGSDCVESAVVRSLGSNTRSAVGTDTERVFEADLVCLAVGLSPLVELASMAGCELAYDARRGGHFPRHDEELQTSVAGLYVAGDVAGVEEASIAMEQGRLAGLNAARALGFGAAASTRRRSAAAARLAELRGEAAGASQAGLTSGPPPGEERFSRGPVAILDCSERIPCNPCESACPGKAIRVGRPVTNLPVLDYERCTGCGRCISRCPGLAIVTVDLSEPGRGARVSLAHEMLPRPRPGEAVETVDGEGKSLARGEVLKVKMGHAGTPVVTVRVPREIATRVRGIRSAVKGIPTRIRGRDVFAEGRSARNHCRGEEPEGGGSPLRESGRASESDPFAASGEPQAGGGR